ncbi:antitoxin [Faecalicoccus pleomorphus]|uniref:Antitoxin n=1 Tax=Faecalicoccus pleomorphus TaxID=1323 RepID=A0AAW6CMQ0_9FIRM|nr:antitoxin [Faecalicoccus pleomorphus]MDB7979220.1 antitoxin [Faecalicoccus pleomorphus]MDB7981648.1 antitoxin [Faecalicoccus pleomorphus]
MKRKMDQVGLLLCDIQGKIFEQSVIREECSSNIFIRRYMNSKFVSRMDNLTYINESMTIEEIFEELDIEYGKTSYGKIKFSVNEMYWIGYIYRYLSYVYQIDSKNAYKIIKGTELRHLFFAYHSLDPMSAIDRILEAKSLVLDKDSSQLTKEGVKILRSIKKLKN